MLTLEHGLFLPLIYKRMDGKGNELEVAFQDWTLGSGRDDATANPPFCHPIR